MSIKDFAQDKKIFYWDAIFIIGAIGIGIIVGLLTKDWIISLAIALFVEILAQILRFRIEFSPFLNHIIEDFETESRPFTKINNFSERAIPLICLSQRPSGEIFEQYYNSLVEDFRENLLMLERGIFILSMNDVRKDSDPSLIMCKQLKSSAFCTALEKNLKIFMSKKGQEIKREGFEAAKRLSSGSFIRLFIFEDFASITWDNYCLMQENMENKITVLVALKTSVKDVFKRFKWDEWADFGLWDEEILMIIVDHSEGRKMHVYKTHEEIDTAKRIISELRNVAWSWNDFYKEFTKPINYLSSCWSTTPEKRLELDPPNGPANQDILQMCRILALNISDGDHIAIYGLTAKLIEGVYNLIHKVKNISAEIDVIDVRPFRPEVERKGLRYIEANWLTWKPDYNYHVILGDDILCNLGIWQIPLFFSVLYSIMVPHGIFITRTMAMFSPDTMHPTWDESMDKLCRFDPSSSKKAPNTGIKDLTEGAIYEIAVPTLHSSDFYDEKNSSFDVVGWDNRLKHETLHTDFKSKLRLPYRSVMTSLNYGCLKKIAAPFFRVTNELPVFSVWEGTDKLKSMEGAELIISKFKEYYKIIVFEKSS